MLKNQPRNNFGCDKNNEIVKIRKYREYYKNSITNKFKYIIGFLKNVTVKNLKQKLFYFYLYVTSKMIKF